MSDIRIETDEDGFWIVLDLRDGFTDRYPLRDAEAFYDHVKAAIGPWLYERDQAKAEYDRAKRAGDTRLMDDQQFTEYLDDAYGDDWSKRTGMEQMRERGIA